VVPSHGSSTGGHVGGEDTPPTESRENPSNPRAPKGGHFGKKEKRIVMQESSKSSEWRMQTASLMGGKMTPGYSGKAVTSIIPGEVLEAVIPLEGRVEKKKRKAHELWKKK